MRNSILVVANGSRAHFYSLAGDALTTLGHLDHPAGRARPSDLETDRPGRQLSDAPGGHSSGYEKEVSPHRHELQRFAREIRDELDRQRRDTGIATVAIFAPPQFLGELRSVIGEGPSIVAWLNRDYTALGDAAVLAACRDLEIPGARLRAGA